MSNYHARLHTKDILRNLGVLSIAFLLIFSLAGCNLLKLFTSQNTEESLEEQKESPEPTSDPIVGVWELNSYKEAGKIRTRQEYEEASKSRKRSFVIEFSQDGTGKFRTYNTVFDLTWKKSSDGYTVTVKFTQSVVLSGSIKDDTLALDNQDRTATFIRVSSVPGDYTSLTYPPISDEEASKNSSTSDSLTDSNTNSDSNSDGLSAAEKINQRFTQFKQDGEKSADIYDSDGVTVRLIGYGTNNEGHAGYIFEITNETEKRLMIMGTFVDASGRKYFVLAMVEPNKTLRVIAAGSDSEIDPDAKVTGTITMTSGNGGPSGVRQVNF